MFISASHDNFAYMGRIDFTDKEKPVFVYPSTNVRFKLKGKGLKVVLENHHSYRENYFGYIVDGKEGKLRLSDELGKGEYEIPITADKDEHEITIFKRMDSCHYITFYGIEVEQDAALGDKPRMYRRKIEVYGDSLTAGAHSELNDYVGKEDPEITGEYSNSACSWVDMLADNLHAQIHNISAGGLALLDGEGSYGLDAGLDTRIGMETVFDKIQCNPALGDMKVWDFDNYTPHLVIVALGQNDRKPEDYMKNDPRGSKAANWKEHYTKFLLTIREKYPKASIMCCTSIKNHSPAWDRAIGVASCSASDPKIYHYIFPENACGTPGHIRQKEAEAMSFEAAKFVMAMGDQIWD